MFGGRQQHPRFCEYSRHLYCSTCHVGDRCILPWAVLDAWDFRPRPVARAVHDYLDSIFDKPVLCVSGVNPGLYSRVALLAKVREARLRLAELVARGGPAQAKMSALLGSRGYLVENGEFFAMRELVDLSKGMFAELPRLLGAVEQRLRHRR